VARFRASSSAKKVGSNLGRAGSWCHLGAVASASLSVEWHPAERVVIRGVFLLGAWR